jgi:hypothetical protein
MKFQQLNDKYINNVYSVFYALNGGDITEDSVFRLNIFNMNHSN